MKPTIRSLAIALFTFLQASVALSDAPLIWGPNNTAKLLNSGELVGKNGDIYLHSAVPLIFPAANAKGPLINNGTGTLSWLVGNTNSFVGFNSTGDMISIPGYSWDQTTQALNANTNFDPFVNGYTAYSLNANSLPTADNVNNISVLNTFTNCGGDDSGFSCGDPATGAGGLYGINSGVNSTNKSSVGHTQLFNGYSQFGNGTDPITVHDMNGMSIGETLGTGVSMVYANQFTSNMQAQAGSSLSSFTAFSEQSFLTHLLQNYSGIQLNTNITTIDGYYNAYGDNPNLTTVHGGYNSANFSPNIGSVSGTYNGISISPNVVSSALTAEQFQITAVADVAQSLASKYLTFCEPYTNGGTCWAPWFKVSGTGTDPMVPGYTMVEVDIATGDTAATVGTALYNAVNALTVNLTWADSGTGVVTGTAVSQGQANQANAQDSGFAVVMTAFGGGDGQAVGLNINMGNATGFADGNVKAIDANGNVNINGKLQTGTNAPMTDQGGTQAQPVNTINTNFTVAPGVTVNNADMFGFGPIANLTMGANSHANASPGLGVGASSLGMIGLITMDNGSTATNVNGSFIAQVLVGGTGAGGVIDDMNAYRAVSANFGSPTTVTNSRAFLADDTLGAPATNHWGFYAKSSFENYMGKSLKIGGTAGVADKVSNSSVGLEIDPTLALLPDPMTTTVRDSLTPLTGMLVNNSTTNQLERYDGAAWVAVGGGFTGTTGSVPFVGGGGSLTEDNTKFFWNDSTKRLGIGTNTPTQPLEIVTAGSDGLRVVGTSSTNFATFEAVNDANHYFFATTSGSSVSTGFLDANQALLYTDAPNGLRFTTESTVPMEFRTNNTEAMRITGGQNVGIGTSSPASKLTVSNGASVGGSVPTGSAFTVSGTGNSNRFVTADGNKTLNLQVTGASNYGELSSYDFGINAAFPVYLNANGGNVGIGALAAESQLTVTGNASVGTGYNNSPAPPNGLLVQGNVGIGTTNPVHNLQIDKGQAPGGGVTTWANTVLSGAGINNALSIVDGTHATYFTSDATGAGSAQISTYDYGASSGFPMFFNNNGGNVSFGPGGAVANQATIQGNASIGTGYNNSPAPPNGLLVQGNVGIGTSSPGFTLDVVQSSNSGLRVTNNNSGGLADLLAWNDLGHYASHAATGSTFASGLYGPDKGLFYGSGFSNGTVFLSDTGPLELASATAVNLTMTQAGNIGIGTTSPATKFDVAGKFQVDSNGNPLKVNNVATSFPASQGAASTVLLNDGAGNLSWASTPAALPTNIATLSGGTTTLTSSDNQLQYYTLTAASTVKLPQTGIPAGYTFTFYAKGSFDLTVQANNGTNITSANSANQDATIRYGTVTLVANVASPNTVTDWSVANVNEYYSDSNTTSGAFATVVNASYTRNNHVVLLDWSTGSTDASGTPTSSTTLNWGNIPSRFRPSTERTGSTTVSSSAYQGGVVQVSSGGAITIYKSFQFDPLSNAQPSRVFAFSMSWSI